MVQASSFASFLAQRFPIARESDVHPHVPEERADQYSSVDAGSTEVEVLSFLNALVMLFKPLSVLETGTFRGFGTLAIAAGIKSNGNGQLFSVDSDPKACERAAALLDDVDLELLDCVHLRAENSLEFISRFAGKPFDLVFFDSDTGARMLEFDALVRRDLLAPGAVLMFHDTSRHRGSTFGGNATLVAALDDLGKHHEHFEFPNSRGFRLLRYRRPTSA